MDCMSRATFAHLPVDPDSGAGGQHTLVQEEDDDGVHYCKKKNVTSSVTGAVQKIKHLHYLFVYVTVHI